MNVPISGESGECLLNMMKYSKIRHNGKIIKDVKSSWAGIYLVYEDGSCDTFYLGDKPLVMQRVK